MNEGMVAEPRCAACDAVASRIELVPPHRHPVNWPDWSDDDRVLFDQHRDGDRIYLLFRGITASNGIVGNPIDPDRASRIRAAFAQPHTYAQVHNAGFYDDAGFCAECDLAYCHRHWNTSITGYGHCPQGHGKSLDPHWDPE